MEFKACDMKGEGGRSYLKNVANVLTLVWHSAITNNTESFDSHI